MIYSTPKICLLAACVTLSACATSDSTSNHASLSPSFSFIVLGDTPYTANDDVMLSKAIPTVKSENPPFIIHIGDYKGGGSPCTSNHDNKYAKMLAELSPIPVVYTPGDNEWTDCDRNTDPKTGLPYSELSRLDFIRTHFVANAITGAKDLKITRQKKQAENATWTYQGVRFLTLNVAGTNNGRDQVLGDPLKKAGADADNRDSANLLWLFKAFKAADREHARAVIIALHADITDVAERTPDEICPEGAASREDLLCDAHAKIRFAIRDAALTFNKPVFLIHGDTDPFTLNQSFAGEEVSNLWRLNAAGDAGPGYGIVDVTRVSVDFRRSQPFSAQGVMTSRMPDKN